MIYGRHSTHEPKADHKVLTNRAVWFIICKNKSLYLEIIPCYLLNSIDFSHLQVVFSSNLCVTTRSNLWHNHWTKLDLFEDWLRFSIDSFCLSAKCTSLNEQFTTEPFTLLHSYLIQHIYLQRGFSTSQGFQFRTWSVYQSAQMKSSGKYFDLLKMSAVGDSNSRL